MSRLLKISFVVLPLLIVLSGWTFFQTASQIASYDLAQAKHVFQETLRSQIEEEGGANSKINVINAQIDQRNQNQVWVAYRVTYVQTDAWSDKNTEISYLAVSTMQAGEINEESGERDWEILNNFQIESEMSFDAPKLISLK